jgi:hypothetical protein
LCFVDRIAQDSRDNTICRTFVLRTKGFKSADDIVYWELKDSDGETKLNGYFHTDGNGEVNDQTALEDVSKDHYKIYLGMTQILMEY